VEDDRLGLGVEAKEHKRDERQKWARKQMIIWAPLVHGEQAMRSAQNYAAPPDYQAFLDGSKTLSTAHYT
jgi:hypothetical protein